MTGPQRCKVTPLHSAHLQLGAKMVEFSGWEMPLYYTGILDEHQAVRRAVGLFDVSHMGEIEIHGPDALALAEYVTCNRVSRLEPGQAQYSGLLYPHGGFVDDVLVHRTPEGGIFICVNAANQEKDYEHIRSFNRWNAQVEFASDRYAQIAVQGPRAAETLQPLCEYDLSALRYYRFIDTSVAGLPARVARTGYTGEDGFELYVAPEHAETVWNRLLDAGQPFGIKPCGLGARNTLRLEAGMALYGHEIDATTTPYEAGLGWIVKLDKGDFLGRPTLERQAADGVRRKLAGFEIAGREIARDGYEVLVNGEPAGWVTSGAPSPTLNRNIGMAYLPSWCAAPGNVIQVLVRGKPCPAKVVPLPFYKRTK